MKRSCIHLSILGLSLAAGCSDLTPDDRVETRRSAVRAPAIDFGDCSKLRVAVTVGFGHTCALLSDGTVECGGMDSAGTLIAPAPVPGLTDVTAIAAGWYHTCAIVAGGAVKCWGDDTDGELGDGLTNSHSDVPVTVSGVSGAVAIAAGFHTTCAVQSIGTIRCWGDNTNGQLGNGTFANRSLTPTFVSGISTAVDVAMGIDHGCARLSSNTVSCWGNGTSGQLGNGTFTGSLTPVPVPNLVNVFGIAAGMNHTCTFGPTVANNARCWGSNSAGELGDGTTNDSATPIVVGGGINNTRGIFASSTGSNTCAALSNGTLHCWGDNMFGELGHTGSAPDFAGNLTLVESAAIGFTHACAVRNNGQLLCWGDLSDQPGRVATDPRNIPGAAFAPAGQICRPSAGGCDPAETCDGTSANCPANAFASADTICRVSMGACDPTDKCTGTTAACPPNSLLPRGQICRDPVGICDLPETCPGTGPECPPDQLIPAGTECRPVAGPCDAPERCDGVSVSCPHDLLAPAGVLCRSSAGPCDPGEVCDGLNLGCPVNTLAPQGQRCHEPANICETVEVCSGTDTVCPAWSWIPNCGGHVQGTVSWEGTPLTEMQAAPLRVSVLSSSFPIEPGTGHYESGILTPGRYRLELERAGCGGGTITDIAFGSVDVVAEQSTTADIDLSTVAGRVLGTIEVGGVPVAATIFFGLANGEGNCVTLHTDAQGHFEGFFPATGFSGTVIADASGAEIGTLGFEASTGETINVGLLTPVGLGCATGDDCASGFCSDSVCCDSACGGGNPDDCQACSIEAGASNDGVCQNLPPTRTCRPRADACDIAEMCTGDFEECPEEDEVFPECAPTDLPTCSGSTCASNPIELEGGIGTVGGVELTFGNVSNAGTIAAVQAGSGNPPADVTNGFKYVLGSSGLLYWDINTTATFSSVTLCIQHAPVPNECTYRLQHDAGAGFMDVTGRHCDRNGVDCFTSQSCTRRSVICSNSMTSLSPFAVVEPIDGTGPFWSNVPDTTVAYATSTRGAVVTYATPMAVDDVDGPRPVTCTPTSGSTFAPGKTMVTCSASDVFGNPSSASFTVWVQYQAPTDGSFFLKPVRANGNSVFRIGRAVPVKFQLSGASKTIADLQAHLQVTKISDEVRGTADDDSDEDGDDTDFLFKYRPAKKLYAYRWKTRGESQGTYQLRADLGDEVIHQVTVSLKKPR